VTKVAAVVAVFMAAVVVVTTSVQVVALDTFIQHS
jgi:hypothetical protein